MAPVSARVCGGGRARAPLRARGGVGGRADATSPGPAAASGTVGLSRRMGSGRCAGCARASLNGKGTLSGDGGDVWLLDYGAGNVRSIRNAIKYLGYTVRDVTSPQDLYRPEVDRLVFPGVGAFGSAMRELERGGYVGALRDYIREDRPFFGICIGMQVLFEGSEESAGVEGLGVLRGAIGEFEAKPGWPVPHIGWNTVRVLPSREANPLLPQDSGLDGSRLYFVHSYRATQAQASEGGGDWRLAESAYGPEGEGRFVAAVSNGSRVFATQFHPEKSGAKGLQVLGNFLASASRKPAPPKPPPPSAAASAPGRAVEADAGLAKRVIACLDVRSNDAGDLVVTKGDQYDVREKEPTPREREGEGEGGGEGKGEGSGQGQGDVRNLGKPVDLATEYFAWGADEVAFLNITGFRDSPLADLPMLDVLRRASERVFVPLTVGGGIRAFKDGQGKEHSSVDVAAAYFASGADKVSIGGDAVFSAEDYWDGGREKRGASSIEQISERYGRQAVVVSIDPRRVYVHRPEDTPLKTVPTSLPGPHGEAHCWWQCTVKGGREGRPIGAYEVALAVEDLGAGEILLNCIDRDGTGAGFDLELVDLISRAVNIPVIASSGAGSTDHFIEVFENTRASAALAAGIFHRKEIKIDAVKEHMRTMRIPTRVDDGLAEPAGAK